MKDILIAALIGVGIGEVLSSAYSWSNKIRLKQKKKMHIEADILNARFETIASIVADDITSAEQAIKGKDEKTFRFYHSKAESGVVTLKKQDSLITGINRRMLIMDGTFITLWIAILAATIIWVMRM